MVIRGADAAHGRHLAERLRAAIVALEIRHDGVAIPITPSFGVSQIRSTDADLDDSIKRADAAMHIAKQLGRNCVEIDT